MSTLQREAEMPNHFLTYCLQTYPDMHKDRNYKSYKFSVFHFLNQRQMTEICIVDLRKQHKAQEHLLKRYCKLKQLVVKSIKINELERISNFYDSNIKSL